MGLTKPRAAQIYNLDYKQATRVITTTDITLSGGAPNSVDGVNLALNDRVLVIGQSTGSQNGIYKVTSLGAGSNGTWTRTTDADATGEIEAGMIIMVTEGNIYADTQWKLTTNDPIVIGTTSLTFVINILSSVGGSNTQVQFNDGGTLAGSSALTFDKSTNILSVNGNISGNYYIGNGSQLTGISSSGGSSISNGTSNVNVVSSGGNVTVGVGEISNVAVFAITGEYVTGVISANGNVTGGNIDTIGVIVATANITGGNVLTGGLISATGNVTGNYILGNGASLTGVITSVSNINNGTSNVTIVSSGGNVTVGVGGTPDVAVFATTGGYINGVLSVSGNITSAANITGGNVLTGGLISATSTITSAANITGGNVLTGGLISATSTITSAANVIGGNVLTGGLISATANITSAANITGGNVLTGGLISAASTITSAANITGGNLLTGGLISVSGTVTSSSLLGSVISASANITGGNVLTGGLISANGTVTASSLLGSVVSAIANVTGGNVLTGGIISATGNVTGGNVLTVGLISATSTVTGSSLLGSVVSATANITGGNLLTGGLISATANITGGNLNASGLSLTGTVSSNLIPIANITYSLGNSTNRWKDLFLSGNTIILGDANLSTSGSDFSVSGNISSPANINGANIIASANITSGNANITTQINTTSVSASGNIRTAGTVSSTGTVTSSSLLGTVVSASANITGGNVLTGGLISATGNTTAAALITTNNNTGFNVRLGDDAWIGDRNITNGFAITGINNSTAGYIQFGSDTTLLGRTGTGALTWGSQFSTTGNVTVPALITTNNGSGFNVKIGDDVWLGDVNVGDTMSIRGVSTPTNGYIIFGSSNETALGRSGTGPLTYGGAFSASGNVTGGNVLTGGLISATSTITSAANITGGNVLTGGLISATANITGGNVLTGGLISATGNITGGNVNTNNLVGTAITITSTGALNLTPTGNITVNNKNINNLADPVADQDAATKAYVDAFAQGLNIHDAVYAATTTTLATTTSGTITYNNGSSGVGATLTTTGTFNLIDTANVQTANTRILVKNEANAVTNGVYVWSNATAITRASDYNTVPEVEAGDFMFVLNGNVYGNTAWVQTSTVTGIGTVGNNIVFTQFAAAAEYTGNTSAGISIVGTVISALVDNTTTAFDGSGNISVKAGAQLTTPNIGAATGTSLSTTANITGGNINTGGLISATGNITGGNVLTVGLMSATGNISANYFIGNGSLLTGISGGGSYSNANVAAYLPTYPGNLVSLTGPVTTTGNITGDYIYGNGYYLTGISGGTNIAPLAGTVDNFTGNGVQTNFTLSTTPTSVNLIFVNVNGVYQLPAAYSLSTNVLTMTSAVPNGAVLSVTQLSGGGIANSLVNGSSNIVVAASGNISMSAAGTANVAVVASNGLYLTGTITVNTGNAATAIVNGAANGVGNIGSSTTYFDTVFAKATSAQYADLAEMYVSDFGYVPGTVVVFGGEQEVTLATTTDDHRVAGVVSTNPSYLMNSIQQGEYVIPVALTGRVPCKVTGTIRKGDLMVTAGNGHAYANNRAQSGTIIGKALENHSGESGVIEVVVGTR